MLELNHVRTPWAWQFMSDVLDTFMPTWTDELDRRATPMFDRIVQRYIQHVGRRMSRAEGANTWVKVREQVSVDLYRETCARLDKEGWPNNELDYD